MAIFTAIMKHWALGVALSLPSFDMAYSETIYGSFRFDDRAPKVLFLAGQIQTGDSFELREALRDHEIDIVVMASAGGNLYEGLQMGAILRDKGIGTFVPKGASCESSCANMFLGGLNRKAEGKLGVHQFYSPNGESAAPLGEVQATAQYTMSEVIGILNDLDTPPFVYEKMLGTSEIYYFSEAEMRKLDLGADDANFVQLHLKVSALIAEDPQVISRFGPQTTAAMPQTTPDRLEEPTDAPVKPPPEQYERVDFFGADLSEKGFRNVSLSECDEICRENPSCAAWSYVHETRWCWPKFGVTNFSIATGITSGVVDYSKVDVAVLERPFLEVTAIDLPGFDLIPTGIPNSTLEDCRSACEASSDCLAFTWLGKKQICFPKYAAGNPLRFIGAISGIKN
jgi:hypothetical protein